MNWEAISAVSEIVGALVVVVTLLFIVREIRQNNKSLSITALRDSTAQWNQWSEMIATSSDLADIVVTGNLHYEKLGEAQLLRYGAYIQSFFDNVESYRAMVIDHNMDKDLHVLEAIVKRRIEIPGFYAWWKQNSSDYNESFVAWIDAQKASINPIGKS